MTLLELEGLTVMRDECPVVDRFDLRVGEGEFVGLLGPNGAGKTTLMRAALGLLPARGVSSLAALPERERSRRVAWLPQAREIAWPVEVRRVVELGRLPHAAHGAKTAMEDARAVDAALDRMDLRAFEGRPATELSGGEQARVLIARALSQETPLLLADEPIAGLDPEHQLRAMAVFADLARSGRGVVAALHDLALAAAHCSRLVLMHRGRLVADGQPRDVLTPGNVATVFRVRGGFDEATGGFRVLEPLA